MNKEEYQQIKRIFQTAIDLPPEKRSAYLNNTCRDNQEVRQQVENLLSSYADDFLEQTAVSEFANNIIAEQLNEGQEIDHYKIVNCIGKGGMGEVYLAQDNNLNRRVALKLLPRYFAEDKERMSRFQRESKFFSALNHPNIVTLFEVGNFEGSLFIVTEFIQGVTLREFVKREKLSLLSALKISIQIVSAMESAHDLGIVHRDMKPDNIMIRTDGIVKVLDFGVAKLIEKREGLSDINLDVSLATNPGTVIGTTNYMSPEQTKGKEVDARSDIFSFGVVLYEMIAGQLPFEGENAVEMIGAILKVEPKPLNAEVPTEIATIISKCLRKDRDERYQTIKDVGNDLKDVKQELELKNLMERSIVPNLDENKTQILQATTLDEINHKTTNQTVASNPKFKYVAVGLLILILALVGFCGYKYSGIQPTKTSFESVKITKVTDSGKVEENVALSRDDIRWMPDGRKFA